MPAAAKAGRTSHVSGYLPAILALLVFYLHIYFGLVHFEERHKDQQLQVFSQQSASILEEMSLHTDPEYFWTTKLHTCYKNSPDPQSFSAALRQKKKDTGGRFSCIIWSADGKVVFDDHFKPRLIDESLLEQLYKDLAKVYTDGKKQAKATAHRLRTILGPNLKPAILAAAIYGRRPEFVRPDSAGKFSDFWVSFSEKFAAMVFFDREMKNPDLGLIQFIQEFGSNDLKLNYFNADGSNLSRGHLKRLETSLSSLEVEGKSATIIQQNMVAGKRAPGMKILVAHKPFQKLLEPGKLAMLLALISIFALALFIKTTAAGFRIENYSVKLQLILMLLVTTGLPLFSLMMVSSDHVARKKAALIKNAYQNCISYVQHVDRRSLIIQSHIANQVNKSIDEMKKVLPEKYTSPEVFERFKMHMGRFFLDVKLIASAATEVVNTEGVYKEGKFTSFNKTFRPEGKTMLELKIFRDVAAYYLSVVNHKSIDLEKFTETELIAEMVYQRPFYEIIQNLILATDKIVTLGLGSSSEPVLVKLISLGNQKIADYFFIVILRNAFLLQDFMHRQFDNLERNPLGLKFIYANEFYFFRNGLLIADNPWFNEIFSKTLDHPPVEPCFTVMDGKEYVYAGMRSQNILKHSLYAFYPLEKIDDLIAEERRMLISAGIITIILLIGLSIIFSSSIVLPLAALKVGAIAIRRKDFSFRFSGLADDEFGEMGRIFNNSIADFEELSLAGIVQARLLPHHEISDDRFELFGKSVPMTELGGDYFDYFQVDSSNYVVMAGDVAGHGVGASLIMAMAKAGVMQCHDCLADPAEVLVSLHQIIHETRTKAQRKVMTFQYLYYNADSGAGVYANAGACSPVLVDREKNETREITLTGPVLGGFKKSKFSNIDLNIAPGQAMVFYTDGIIEALNPEGREIGYEGFKQMLLECHDTDAGVYYSNIFSRYTQWLAGQQAQDDLTIIILSRK